jgi:hypothetical protein
MAERDTKVVYKSRTREQPSKDRDRRYHADDGYRYESSYDDRRRGYRDDYDRRDTVPRSSGDRLESASIQSIHPSQYTAPSAPRSRHSTRSEYDFVQDARDDPYMSTYRGEGGRGASNVIVLDSNSSRSGGEISEWEIIRPERTADGAIIIETGIPRRGGAYESDYGGRRSTRELEIVPASHLRDRSVDQRTLVDAMQEVRVTEEDDRRSTYSRGGRSRAAAAASAAVAYQEAVKAESPPPLRRMPSAFRHHHSPESVALRRSRSIEFPRDQIRNHDASISRHERPGTEAAVAGQYLIRHRGEHLDEDYDGHASLVSIEKGPHARRHHHRSRRYHDEHERDREVVYERRERREDRYYEEDRLDRRSRAYSPQRAHSPETERERDRGGEGDDGERKHHRRRRRHRHHRHDDDERGKDDEDDSKSYVSERYRRTVKEYRD